LILLHELRIKPKTNTDTIRNKPDFFTEVN
jgi:hypothetical protein